MPLQIAAHSQRLAAHPYHSAWVAASAGSGKTKVLTDRVLNLLLEGYSPERILCLTFTKAAAAEMANRLRVRLGEWAILPENELQTSLQSLLGSLPSPEKISYARTLFGLTLDAPGGLKILTIHSFCQSLLKRFPLEAGLSPFFEVIDDSQKKSLLKKAAHQVMEELNLQETLETLIFRFSETTFEEFNNFILQERASFASLHLKEIDKVLHTEGITEKEHLRSLLDFIPLEVLKKNLSNFEEGSSTDQERGVTLSEFLSLSDTEKYLNYETYLSFFLTQKGEKRARLLTQKLALKFPCFMEQLVEEASRLERWVQTRNTLDIAKTSKAFLTYSCAFLKAYETLKKSQSLLDYEDLILKTVDLLKNPGCHWVLYKLDGGLDHILVDEAQDTSPTQWAVIRAIAEEFYANATTDPRNRTLFIVGDDKQSIYSFQGADPNVFSQMQKELRAFAHQSGKTWQDIDLNISFRSTPEVLKVVDAIFTSNSLSPHGVHHLPFRKEAPGHVELWPLLKKEEEKALKPWQLTCLREVQDLPQNRLAKLIAKTIQGWLSQKGPLLRPILPRDILILVRRRTVFVDTLIRSLKECEVPVAGIDRLWLLDGIAIQDLLKIAEFLLLPEDDLTLATVLKGPLFSLSEEDLFDLSYGRESNSLWHRLQKQKRFENVTSLLKDLLSRVDFFTPFSLFSYILGPLEGRKKWQACLGPEIIDSLDEFLNLCLNFQEENTPSLQSFLYWISQETLELKRDLDQSNQVRVMTVHGSKGLQAPIVFLPDTTQTPLDLPSFEFYKKALLWLPPSAKDIPLTKALKDNLREKQQEEYRRLLYVALTRAEDALYICGWEGNSQETWYDLALQGMKKVGEEVTFDFSPYLEFQGKGWRLSSTNEGQLTSPVIVKPTSFLVPPWLRTRPFSEEAPKYIRPSQEKEDLASFIPSSYDPFGTKKGILIHRLLQTLPLTPNNDQERIALRFLEKEQIPADVAREMAASAIHVLNTYPDLFGTGSQSEVPVIGMLGDSFFSGQIDRLIIHEDHILIVDFKTYISPPGTIKEIPLVYLKQMAHYKIALSHIYPQKDIFCALLWTHIPRLDLIPDSVLKNLTPIIDVKPVEVYTKKNLA
ncbi:MAG: double-strand break repair helicase AddA [Alphaproteobacteria bacterium]|nr:double-strand break repair helicase AddA [Alphaproteobacteria bacterium]